jgi:hypothetical protein
VKTNAEVHSPLTEFCRPTGIDPHNRLSALCLDITEEVLLFVDKLPFGKRSCSLFLLECDLVNFQERFSLTVQPPRKLRETNRICTVVLYLGKRRT